MGLFSSSSKSSSAVDSNAVSLQDVQGTSIAGNKAAVTITDAGAFKVVENLGMAAFNTAAELTMGFVTAQQQASAAALDTAFKTARPESAATADANKTVLIVGGILAAAVVVMGWKK